MQNKWISVLAVAALAIVATPGASARWFNDISPIVDTTVNNEDNDSHDDNSSTSGGDGGGSATNNTGSGGDGCTGTTVVAMGNSCNGGDVYVTGGDGGDGGDATRHEDP